MTHYAALVLIPDGAPVEEAVGRLLAPYDEARVEEDATDDRSRWDWWQIGGRQTGMLDATYDAHADPSNQQPCGFCEDGITTDRIAALYPAYQPHVGKTCIQCNGSGHVTKFPGRWQSFDGDVKPVAAIDFDRIRYLPTAVVTPDGEWHERVEGGWGMFAVPRGPEKAEDAWGREFARLLDLHRDAVAVVVDCHV
jgi:hypothetical protein